MNSPIKVKLLESGTTPDPLKAMYIAFRVDYSSLTPEEVSRRMDEEQITEAQMMDFIEKRFETGHNSPLYQVWFQFGISGVSRAFSHQFVRHNNGISFEQQSQRYVTFKGGEFPYTVPETIKESGVEEMYVAEMERIGHLYDHFVKRGVPAEDARFLLPNATHTNFVVSVNFAELQHIADLRLCTRAQWEFRKTMALMRGEVNRRYPWLGKVLGPKCMSFRMGYCDEAFSEYEKCPLSKKRPHKSQVIPV